MWFAYILRARHCESFLKSQASDKTEMCADQILSQWKQTMTCYRLKWLHPVCVHKCCVILLFSAFAHFPSFYVIQTLIYKRFSIRSRFYLMLISYGFEHGSDFFKLLQIFPASDLSRWIPTNDSFIVLFSSHFLWLLFSLSFFFCFFQFLVFFFLYQHLWIPRKGLYISDVPIHDATRDLVLLSEQFEAGYKLTRNLEVLTDKLQQTYRELESEKQKTDR